MSGNGAYRACYRCGEVATHFVRAGSLGQRQACERHAKSWPREVFGRPDSTPPGGTSCMTPADHQETRR